MKKKNIVSLIILIFILITSGNTYGESLKTVVILVDELPLDRVEDLATEDYSLGLMNLKTRKPYSEESLYLTLSTGKKVGVKEGIIGRMHKEEKGTITIERFSSAIDPLMRKTPKLELLGEVLKKEGVSFIGEDLGSILAADKKGNIAQGEISIKYDIDWLKQKTDQLLRKNNILVLSYDVENDSKRVELLKEYLNYVDEGHILIIPKEVSSKYSLNKFLVPIMYKDMNNSGILTSKSTKRSGFVAIEDISTHIKETYGYKNKSDIGKPFKIIYKDNPLLEIKSNYNQTINLFLIAYLFHGITYLTQGIYGIYLLKGGKERNKKIYIFYSFVAINILVSLILGFLQFHTNIVLYLFINLIFSYFITIYLVNKNINIIGLSSVATYAFIVFGIIFYPKIIYDSYIGFNNLVYGARYYGLNNGIMGVLLATSIITFFQITKNMKDSIIKKILFILLFGLNMVALSVNFGANTGGFITSIALFIIMMYFVLFNRKSNYKTIGLLIIIGLLLFGMNMYMDSLSNEKSHAIQFFYRIKGEGIKEFLYMFRFKWQELLKLTLIPPFSLVLISQGVILNKLFKSLKENKRLKGETMIILITSLIGFIINDTGVITLIYMTHYLILLLMSELPYLE
jgi:hypothetical protein